MIILGKKLKMTQIWQGETVIPVTVIQAVPNTVGLVRTKERDGYEAVQLKLGKRTHEFRVPAGELASGGTVDVGSFAEGDLVRVSGTVRGRGFQGVVKRWGFHGGPKTHGQKNRLRAPGSLGATAPQRVVPGRKMAGHMGAVRKTVKNIKVVAISKDDNTIMLYGAVPGMRGGLIEIVKADAIRKK